MVAVLLLIVLNWGVVDIVLAWQRDGSPATGDRDRAIYRCQPGATVLPAADVPA